MGRVVFDLSRRDIREEEQAFAEWVRTRPNDVTVIFGVSYPSEDEPDGEVFDTLDLCVESVVGEKIYVECRSLPRVSSGSPPVWELTERMARERLEQQIAGRV